MSSMLLAGKRKRIILIATAVCLFMQTCLMAPPRAWGGLSLSEEKELGNNILAKIREHMPLVEDGEILTYVQSVGERIVKQLGITTYDFRFFVVDESIPNAFAVPGGYIFIYRGLVEMMSSEGELAGILCHELGHIQAHHMSRRMDDSKLLNVAAIAGVLAGVLLGMNGGAGASQALAMGTMAGASSFGLMYSRENEEEADQLGLRYLTAAGYAPENMVSIMQKMSQGKWRSGPGVPSYLSTHPALSERVQYLQDLVQKYQGKAKKSGQPPTVGDFGIMQAALVAEYGQPAVAFARFQEGAKKGDAVGAYGMGRFLLRQGKVDEALPYLLEAARMESASPFVLSTLGAAYIRKGRLAEAKRVLQTALLLNPTSSIVHYRLALILQDLGEKEEALQHLMAIEDLAGIYLEIDYQLGILLGKVNQLGLAHYHLGRYYFHKQDWRLAFFHYSKAKSLLRDSPLKLAEVDRVLKDVEEKKDKESWEKKRK